MAEQNLKDKVFTEHLIEAPAEIWQFGIDAARNQGVILNTRFAEYRFRQYVVAGGSPPWNSIASKQLERELDGKGDRPVLSADGAACWQLEGMCLAEAEWLERFAWDMKDQSLLTRLGDILYDDLVVLPELRRAIRHRVHGLISLAWTLGAIAVRGFKGQPNHYVEVVWPTEGETRYRFKEETNARREAEGLCAGGVENQRRGDSGGHSETSAGEEG